MNGGESNSASWTALVVEDDDGVVAALTSVFDEPWEVRTAQSVWQAWDVLAELDDLRLALVDLDIPGGRPFDSEKPGGGFEVIERIRSRFPTALVVVVTAHATPRMINAAQRLGAEFIVKEDYIANVEALVRRLRRESVNTRIRAHARELQEQHGLTERQREIVELAISGYRNVEIADALAISINTMKAHAREIVRACNVSRLDELARNFWREGES